MNEEKKKYSSEDDIEKLLAPRCEFHVSNGFQEKIMQEVTFIQKKRRRRWISLATFMAAASITATLILTALHFFNADNSKDRSIIVAETTAPFHSDSLSEKNHTALFAKVQEVKNEKGLPEITDPPTKNVKTKKSNIKKPHTETRVMTIPEGELPMISKDDSMDPEEVRQRLLETRRNADIAFIDRMRDEIEDNQAYISSLINLENESE